MMNKTYVETVRLPLEIAPAVFERPHFAMKGGTAINLFVENMPRLSVDIDVVYTNHRASRNDALESVATQQYRQTIIRIIPEERR
jgi:predicted nucleotidyltransferase component of viral defense system